MPLDRLANIYTTIIWALAGLLLALFLYRVLSLFIKGKSRQVLWKVHGYWFPKTLKALFGITMALTLFYAIPFAVVGSAFRQLIPELANTSLLAITILLCVLECVQAFTISDKLKVSVFKKVMLSLIVAALFPLAFYFAIYVPEIFDYPSRDACYTLELPTKGLWRAGHAGGSEIVNYHCAYPDQVYAMDVSKLGDNGRIYRNKGAIPEDFFTFGDSIFAPISGTIVFAMDSLENAAVSMAPSDTINPAGNHVVIEFEADRFVFLAHLNKHSVRVKKGDKVLAGQYLGKAGNSGNTSWPHLHMHVQDLPYIDFKNAKGYPYRFSSMQRNRWYSWQTVLDDFLLRNDRFRPVKH